MDRFLHSSVALATWIRGTLCAIPLGSLLLAFHCANAEGSLFAYDASGNLVSQSSATAAAPSITGNPNYQVTAPGGIAGFSVNASSVLPITYQWNFKGDPIDGATGDSLLLEDVSSAQEGDYTVTVTNSLGSVTSGPGRLYVVPVPAKFLLWRGGDGDFNDPANWSEERLPETGDTVVIDTGTFTPPASGALVAGEVRVSVPFSTNSDITLNVTGIWRFSGGFNLASAKTFAVGGGGSVIVTGSADIEGASLRVDGPGSKLSIAGITEYEAPAGTPVQWLASGAQTELTFPALQSIAGNATPGYYFDLRAQYGGKISLPALAEISKPADGDPYPNSGVRLYATHEGALLAAPLLASFEDEDPQPDSALVAQGDGTLSVPLLLEPVGTNIDLNAQSTPQQFISLEKARQFAINHGTVSMDELTSIEGLAQIYIYGGAKVSFPNETGYSLTRTTSVGWYCDGVGSELSFPNLASLAGNAIPGCFVDLYARYGGKILLPALTSITKPADGDPYHNSGIRLNALYEGAVLSAPLLTAFNDQDSRPFSHLAAQGDGTLHCPLLTAPVGTSLDLNAQSNPQQFVSLENAQHLWINGGVVSMNPLLSIAAIEEIYIYGGAKVSFPHETSFTLPAGRSIMWYSDGVGTWTAFPNLTTITGNASPGGYLKVSARYGGEFSFPALASVSKPSDGDNQFNSGIWLQALHEGAKLSAPLLTTFLDQDPFPYSALVGQGTGVLSLPQLTAPVGASLDLNAESTPQQYLSLEHAHHLWINRGIVSMALSSIEPETEVYIYAGARVSFPDVVSYTHPGNGHVSWYSSDQGTELNFPSLETINGSTTPGSFLDIIARYGAVIRMPALRQIHQPAGGVNSGMRFQVYGNNAMTLLPSLELFRDEGQLPVSAMTVGLDGSLHVPNLDLVGALGVQLNGITLPELVIPHAKVATSGESATIGVPSLSHHNYRLQHSPDLSPGSWQDTGPAQTGGNGELQFLVPKEDGPHHFYRVQVSAAP